MVENAANNSNLEYNKDVGEVLKSSLSSDMKNKLDELDKEKNKRDGSESKKREREINKAVLKSEGVTGNYTGLRVLEKVGDNSTEVLQDPGIEEKKKIKVSMDGKGRALDNVFIERFWRSLKQEKIYMIILNTVKEAKNAITNYINFYNEKRMHQSLEYLTPEQVYFRKNIV